MSCCDLRWSWCGAGPIAENEEVGVGPEDLVVVYIGCNVFPQVDEAVYCVVENELVCECRLQVVLSECQNLAEVFRYERFSMQHSCTAGY